MNLPDMFKVPDLLRRLDAIDDPAAEDAARLLRRILESQEQLEFVKNYVCRGPRRVKVSPSEMSIIRRLWDGYPGVVPTQEIYTAVYGRNIKRSAHTLRALIWRSRARAYALGVQIVSEHKSGYKLMLVAPPLVVGPVAQMVEVVEPSDARAA